MDVAVGIDYACIARVDVAAVEAFEVAFVEAFGVVEEGG